MIKHRNEREKEIFLAYSFFSEENRQNLGNKTLHQVNRTPHTHTIALTIFNVIVLV